MKFYSITLCLISIFAFSCTSSVEESDYLVLSGATVYDGNGNAIKDATIITRNGVIETVANDSPEIPNGSEVIDLAGKFVTPGLIDAHVHFFQTAFFDARPDALDLRDSLPYEETFNYQKEHPERYYEAYLRTGITGVYDVGGFDWSVGLQQSAENNPNAPHVAAAGQLITPAPENRIAIFNLPGSNVMVHLGSGEVGRQTVVHNSQLGSTGIKIWGMAASDSVFMKSMEAVVDEIQNQNNKLIVHATNLEGAKAALTLGARLLVHSVEDQLVDDEFIEVARKNETVLTPTLVVFHGYYNTYRAVLGEGFELRDPNNVVDDKTKGLLEHASRFSGLVDTAQLRTRIPRIENALARRDSVMALNLVRLYEAGVLIAVGTDAGNPGTVHGPSIYDEMERMQEFGIPANQIIVMATRNGALAMDRLEDFGTLEPGKMANLIILDEDPAEDISHLRSITHFMKGGNLRPVNQKFQ